MPYRNTFATGIDLMLKKLTTLLAVAFVLTACAACGVKNDPEPPKPSSEEAQ